MVLVLVANAASYKENVDASAIPIFDMRLLCQREVDTHQLQPKELQNCATGFGAHPYEYVGYAGQNIE
jgi:hypothetical protein